MKVREIKVSYNLPMKNDIQISNSNELFEIVKNHWNLNTIQMQEEFKVVFLNFQNQIIGLYELSKGGLSGTVVDTKLIMSVALKCLSSNIIMVHNHPSGNLVPSENDIQLTNKIKDACFLLDIKLLDHLIISKYGYYSFADDGKI